MNEPDGGVPASREVSPPVATRPDHKWSPSSAYLAFFEAQTQWHKPSLRAGSSDEPESPSVSAGETSVGRIEKVTLRRAAAAFRDGDAELDEVVVSLLATGMTLGDIRYHILHTSGENVSMSTVSSIVADALERMETWQNRPLEPLYPVVYVESLPVRVIEAGRAHACAARYAVGIDTHGSRHVLGFWVESGAPIDFWSVVRDELAGRGIQDIILMCSDDEEGLAEAIAKEWPAAPLQTNVIQLLRECTRYVNHRDRKAVLQSLRPVYMAANEREALIELGQFESSDLGRAYPATTATWRHGWDRFTPLLALPLPVRRVVTTTSSLETLHGHLRRVSRTRGHFDSPETVRQLFWLAIRDSEESRARERAAATSRREQAAHKKLIEGSTTQGWSEALGGFVVDFPERFAAI